MIFYLLFFSLDSSHWFGLQRKSLVEVDLPMNLDQFPPKVKGKKSFELKQSKPKKIKVIEIGVIPSKISDEQRLRMM